MPNILALSNASNILINIDKVCERIPVASTVTNLVNIFEKCVFDGGCCSPRAINENRYFSHINDKSYLRCAVLLIPILGNIIVAVYDVIQTRREREELNRQARLLGLGANQLPDTIPERREAIEQARKTCVEAKLIRSLDLQIPALRFCCEQFKRTIDNPEEPLLVELLGFTCNGTHQEKINYFWDYIKLSYALIQFEMNGFASSLAGIHEEAENPQISAKKLEIVALKKDLLDLRRTSYREHILGLQNEDLLTEAKEYYSETFSSDDRQAINESLKDKDFPYLMPKLKERVLFLANKPEEAVEIQEIVSLIDDNDQVELVG